MLCSLCRDVEAVKAAQGFEFMSCMQLVVAVRQPAACSLCCCCRQLWSAMQCLALVARAKGHVCSMPAGSLLKLTMNGNHLTAVAPECGQLTNLRELHLQGNQLTELPSQLYQLMVSLTSMMGHTQMQIP